ncbi:MAG: NYN domain-containing protein [Candidatus Njordarchaeia archaeon]
MPRKESKKEDKKTKKKKKRKKEAVKISIIIDYSSIKDKDPINIVERTIRKAKEIGKVVKTKVYFLQEEFRENKDLVDEILKLGVEPVIVILAKDVKMAIDLLEDSYSDDIGVILLAYKQESLLPALIDAKNRKTLYFVDFPDLHPSLRNIGDEFIEI